MTIYEQIQQAVDFIEDHLTEKLPAARVADAAFMSLRSLHNHFPAVTGIACGEYVIRRRLAVALERLRTTDESVLHVALENGYESHEAFTRAISREYGASPKQLRARPRPAAALDRLALVKEMYMGVLVRKLNAYRAALFEGQGDNCENKAITAMEKWLAVNADALGPYRIFGHNIDSDGNTAGADYTGYRILVALPKDWSGGSPPPVAELPAGRFVVTGIEGSFEEDPEGRWISDGWKRLSAMMEAKGFRAHPSDRWYEEHLEPVTPGRTRMDLYLEIV